MYDHMVMQFHKKFAPHCDWNHKMLIRRFFPSLQLQAKGIPVAGKPVQFH